VRLPSTAANSLGRGGKSMAGLAAAPALAVDVGVSTRSAGDRRTEDDSLNPLAAAVMPGECHDESLRGLLPRASPCPWCSPPFIPAVSPPPCPCPLVCVCVCVCVCCCDACGLCSLSLPLPRR